MVLLEARLYIDQNWTIHTEIAAEWNRIIVRSPSDPMDLIQMELLLEIIPSISIDDLCAWPYHLSVNGDRRHWKWSENGPNSLLTCDILRRIVDFMAGKWIGRLRFGGKGKRRFHHLDLFFSFFFPFPPPLLFEVENAIGHDSEADS